MRRFFIYETISSVEGEGEYLKGIKPSTAYRWAGNIQLRVWMDKTRQERIYVPYLIINY